MKTPRTTARTAPAHAVEMMATYYTLTHRERQAASYALASKLALAARNAWAVCVDAHEGRVWLESSDETAADLLARNTTMQACVVDVAVESRGYPHPAFEGVLQPR